jgi:predicted DNA-binding transcriptional regulator YafY
MARGDQLSRQWKIIQSLIASARGKPAGELAGELDCHSRTVYRDLEALQQAGFPLFTEQEGGKTYWSIMDAGRHQMPLPMSLTELMALYFSRNMLKELRGTAIYDSLTALFEKVKATLPPAYTQYLDRLAQTLEIGFKAYKPYHGFEKVRDQLNRAIQESRCIDIDYFSMSRNASTQRRVAPYRLWYSNETFYVIGYCQLRQGIRLFALDRVDRLEITDERFEAPEKFDANAFMQSSFGVFQGEPVTVHIRFEPQTAGYIKEKVWHPTQKLVEEEDGGLIFSAEVAGIEEIKFWVLKWGAGATVLAPENLRVAIAGEIEAMAGNYAP